MAKLVPGVNDLATLHPDVAAEANGWDASKVLSGSHQKKRWECKEGHTWNAIIKNRTKLKSGCPFCANKKVLIGFNDLETKFPDIAKEADGWDASRVLSGTHQKKRWKCKEGHTWNASVDSRTSNATGCPECAEYGFNPGEPAWFYLMKRPNEQQFGITNNLDKRIKVHARFDWHKIDSTGPHDGQEVLDTENLIKKWLKKEVGLVPGKTENWFTTTLEVHSLAELKEKSGIETSIF